MVEMKSVAPPRVADVYAFWGYPPVELSPRCKWWIRRVGEGWRRNSRISSMGYDESSHYFGIYIWEYLHVLSPLMTVAERE